MQGPVTLVAGRLPASVAANGDNPGDPRGATWNVTLASERQTNVNQRPIFLVSFWEKRRLVYYVVWADKRDCGHRSR